MKVVVNKRRDEGFVGCSEESGRLYAFPLQLLRRIERCVWTARSRPFNSVETTCRWAEDRVSEGRGTQAAETLFELPRRLLLLHLDPKAETRPTFCSPSLRRNSPDTLRILACSLT